METNILIIGGGNIGNAIKAAIDPSKAVISIYDRNPGRSTITVPFEEAVAQAQVIFFCIPSAAVGETIKEAAPHIREQAFVVSLAKGLEPTSGKFMGDVLRDFLNPEQIALLSGPMLAAEITGGKQGMAMVASENEANFETLSSVFFPHTLKLEYSNNLHGIALAGVLKNIYAIGLGMAAALDWGENKRGWLVAKAVKEMILIANVFGLSEESMLSLAGLGDLVATGFSSSSHNHSVGLRLINEGVLEMSEGVTSLTHIVDKVQESQSQLPILYTVNESVQNPKQAKEIFCNI